MVMQDGIDSMGCVVDKQSEPSFFSFSAISSPHSETCHGGEGVWGELCDQEKIPWNKWRGLRTAECLSVGLDLCDVSVLDGDSS
jgi:hypothetical protein